MLRSRIPYRAGDLAIFYSVRMPRTGDHDPRSRKSMPFFKDSRELGYGWIYLLLSIPLWAGFNAED